MTDDVLHPENTDPFGKLLADGFNNELDIASQYDFSPERVRLFRNGSREFPQYNTVSQFTDGADVWKLQPDAGDTMHIESAESGTYVVNYTMQASWAFQLNQSLSSGDVLRFGPYNGTDGWVFEQRGADHDDQTGDIIESTGGSETTLKSDASLPQPTTEWWRYGVDFGWYAVLNQVWYQTWTSNGVATNQRFAKTSQDGTRGPETGNLNLWIEVQADASTSGLELEVGSMGMLTQGNPVSLNRDKPQYVSLSADGTADTWEPQYAVRTNPARANVNCQFSELEILDHGANADIELLVVSVDPSKTDAGDADFGEPDYHHSSNSALQDTESISQVPNTSGTQTDLGSSEKPGGHTIAASVHIDANGNSSATQGTVNRNRQEKKAVLASDQLVFLTRTGTTGGTLKFVWDVDQNW